MQETYTTEQAAEYLHITQRTIYSYLQNGKLKASKLGGGKYIITAEQLQDFIKSTSEPIKKPKK